MRTLIITLLFPFITSAQSNSEKVEPSMFMDLLRQYEESFPVGESYSLVTAYKIFNDYRDKSPVEFFNGKLICRYGKELNIYQMGHLTVQDETWNITIDTIAKQVLVQKADPAFFYRKTLGDYKIFLEMAETLYRNTVNGKEIYTLQLKKGQPYHSMEFTFADKNFISQVVIYSNQPYYVENDNGIAGQRAKIVLEFKDFRKGKNIDFKSFLTIKDCIQIKDNQVTPVGVYKNFEIIDLRN